MFKWDFSVDPVVKLGFRGVPWILWDGLDVIVEWDEIGGQKGTWENPS
jgi:hypothetical protein